MEKFTSISSEAIPLPIVNIDTDVIMPSDFLKVIKWAGLGAHAFHTLRYDETGAPKPDSPFNDPRFKDAQILIAGDNFGCGSSREHAPRGMSDMGLRCVIASSFADIFAQNSYKLGILLVTLPQDQVDQILEDAAEGPVTVDLESQTVSTVRQRRFSFTTDPFRRHCLLNGLDQIGLTLVSEDAITAYEKKQAELYPWLARK